MSMRTFKKPAEWGIGPGPARLCSIDDALIAVDMWLGLTPSRPETRRERELMLTLRDLLAVIPGKPAPADLLSAKRAIKGMVKYARSREAHSARIISHPSRRLGARQSAAPGIR
ncbi:MAG TPA: hypothetical protein VJR58_10285 [Vineibacter sp.]|nr:hypothetical protein [Vineibacter sp.]